MTRINWKKAGGTLFALLIIGLVIIDYPTAGNASKEIPLASTLLADGKTVMRLVEVQKGPIHFPGIRRSINPVTQILARTRGTRPPRVRPFTTWLLDVHGQPPEQVLGFRFDFVNREGHPVPAPPSMNSATWWFEDSTGFQMKPAAQSMIQGLPFAMAFGTPNAPQRDQKLTLVIQEKLQPDTDRFEIDNPLYQPDVQEWEPEPLPAERTLLGETVRLARNRLTKNGAPFLISPPSIQVLTDNGGLRDTTRLMTLSDATGNRVPFYGWEDSPLSPSERAWKLSISFAHRSPVDLPDDVVWNSPEFDLPKSDGYYQINQTFDLKGTPVKVLGVTGGGLEWNELAFAPSSPPDFEQIKLPDGTLITETNMPVRSRIRNGVTALRFSRVSLLLQHPPVLMPEQIRVEFVTNEGRYPGISSYTNLSKIGRVNVHGLPVNLDPSEKISVRIIRRRLPTAEFLIAPEDTKIQWLNKPEDQQPPMETGTDPPALPPSAEDAAQ